jgi:phage shock protein PspC (stress-responsive transcriptional regulator)
MRPGCPGEQSRNMTTTENTQSSEPHVTLGATPARPSAADRFFGAVRGSGLVRSDDRWVAGVAGGLARRLGVDPLAVRVAFVVLSLFGGLGLGLYGLAWALLPDASGRIEAQAAQRGDVSGALALAVGLVVLDLILGQGLLGLGWIF